MQTYILKRILLFLPTLLGIVLINFAIIQFVPGGPVEREINKLRHGGGGPAGGGEVAMSDASNRLRKGLDPEQLKEIEKLYDFDKPWYVRLGMWTTKLFTFQFGQSYFHHKEVKDLVIEKLPVSASLGVASFFLTYL